MRTYRFALQFKVQEDKDRNVCASVSLLYFLVFYTLTAIGYYPPVSQTHLDMDEG